MENDDIITLDDTFCYDPGATTISNPLYTISSSGTISTISLTGSGLDYGISIVDENRSSLYKDGDVPMDIWAKLFNNGVLDD